MALANNGDGSAGMARRTLLLRAVAGLVITAGAGLGAWGIARLGILRARLAASTNAGRAFSIAAADVPGPGDARRVMLGKRRAWLVRHDDGTLVAFDAACTHQQCVVDWKPEAGRFKCPCHGGAFDGRTGAPLAGPPKTPLVRYAARPSADGTEMILEEAAEEPASGSANGGRPPRVAVATLSRPHPWLQSTAPAGAAPGDGSMAEAARLIS